jgi:hypothetical protein
MTVVDRLDDALRDATRSLWRGLRRGVRDRQRYGRCKEFVYEVVSLSRGRGKANVRPQPWLVHLLLVVVQSPNLWDSAPQSLI